MRRWVSVLAVAVGMSSGSALLASPASAGAVDDRGRLSAGIYNTTPYPWTLVAAKQLTPCPYNDPTGQNRCFASQPPGTLPAGSDADYAIDPNDSESALFSTKFGYDVYFTYRVDLLDGRSDYVTVSVTDCQCSGIYGSSIANVQAWITAQPPPDGFDPARDASPGPDATDGLLTRQAGPQLFDVTVTPVGSVSIDASTAAGDRFANVINAACAGEPSTACSWTQTKPITYGPGALKGPAEANNCDNGATTTDDARTGGADGPPDSDPNYLVVEWSAARSSSLAIGGSVTASVEASLFGTISSEASIELEAEHEWEDKETVSRESKVYIPSNGRGLLWVAPTVGRVTGTLVATIGPATFTATNFAQIASGVSSSGDPVNDPTPDFNVSTKTRPLTAAEIKKLCPHSRGTRIARAAGRRAGPPTRLVVDRSVARVALGETQEALYRHKGWPAERRVELKPCKGMPGCTAVRGTAPTWVYRKRGLSVVLDRDYRVTALEYTGTRRTARGVGKGSSPASVRNALPGAVCTQYDEHLDCARTRTVAGRAVRTVFRLRRENGRWKVAKVHIYLLETNQGRAAS